MTHVVPGAFLTLHYRLAGPQGDVINTFAVQPATLTLGTGELSAALEQRLLGLAEGARRTFELAAGEAFGQRNPQMVRWLPRSELDAMGDPQETYAVGEVVRLPTPDGKGQFAGVVRAVQGDGALLLDFNHPLAGQPVVFEVQLIGVLP
ncbi:MAG: FKBP-type peptidyl-prolyl cis-trans isomerase [Burkholderiaceae bacterium]|jgi:FKBP-type peptidyl-prolyl cis-trans isomerase SlpA|nr:FKBP-type peptidyl-prolyl cis-trans isomerase [Burkholderiaceae bacterium]